jgi:hypothetical protein
LRLTERERGIEKMKEGILQRERENEILKNEQNEEGREKRVQFSNVRRDCL